MPKSNAVPSAVTALRHPAAHLLNLPKVSKATRPQHRRLMREGVTPDGIVIASCKSLTRVDQPGRKAPKHEIEIDLVGGVARCSCENFRFKRSKGGAPVSFRWPHLWCKHIEKAMLNAERKGEVELFYNDDDSLFEAVPTGFIYASSFDEPLSVTGGFDAEHDEYLDELEARAELNGWLHEGEAPYSA